jgi:WD40 repeat protein
LELQELVRRRAEGIAKDLANGVLLGRTAAQEVGNTLSLSHGSQSDLSGGVWVPSGKPVVHVNDHRAGVTKLANLYGMGDGGFFVSSSLDGMVRLWDAGKCNTCSLADLD